MDKHVGTLLPLSAIDASLKNAKQFLDWLAKTRQTLWQLLPLNETRLEPGSTLKHVPSPYQSYGVGLDPALFADAPKREPSKLERAEFVADHTEWINDYGLFVALRDHFGTDNWTTWPKAIGHRTPRAVKEWQEKLAQPIEDVIATQWHLHRTFHALRTHAAHLGIQFAGDIPFYLPLASPLVWAQQHLFQIKPDGSLPRVSGLPIGPKAHFGRQVWGHPLYAFKRQSAWAGLIRLWAIRLHHAAHLYDLVRLDHAKGLYFYGVIDPNNPAHDRYATGPGLEVLKPILEAAKMSGLTLFAEDSGDRAGQLRRTLRRYQIPTVRILRFAYNEKKQKIEEKYIRLKRYPQHVVAYTATHDTETLIGYLTLLAPEEKQRLARRIGVSHQPNDPDTKLAVLLRTALIESPAATIIIPIQDWLLSTERINVPGTEKPVDDPNWHFRLTTPISQLPTNLW